MITDESIIARINLYSVRSIPPEKIPDATVKTRIHYDDIFLKTFCVFSAHNNSANTIIIL